MKQIIYIVTLLLLSSLVIAPNIGVVADYTDDNLEDILINDVNNYEVKLDNQGIWFYFPITNLIYMDGEYLLRDENLVSLLEIENIELCYNLYHDFRRCYSYLINSREEIIFNLGNNETKTVTSIWTERNIRLRNIYTGMVRVRDHAINNMDLMAFLRAGNMDNDIDLERG